MVFVEYKWSEHINIHVDGWCAFGRSGNQLFQTFNKTV